MKPGKYLLAIIFAVILFTLSVTEKEGLTDNYLEMKASTTTIPRVNHVEILHASFGNVDSDENLDGLLVFIKPADEDGNLVEANGNVTMELYQVFDDEDGWKSYGALKVDDEPYVGYAKITPEAYRQIAFEDGFLMGSRIDGWVDEGLLIPGDVIAIFINFTTLDGANYRVEYQAPLEKTTGINMDSIV
ncbi:MAG: hypothetical protein ABH834_01695 [Candidatus Altiarchaeota archaeon]